MFKDHYITPLIALLLIGALGFTDLQQLAAAQEDLVEERELEVEELKEKTETEGNWLPLFSGDHPDFISQSTVDLSLHLFYSLTNKISIAQCITSATDVPLFLLHCALKLSF